MSDPQMPKELEVFKLGMQVRTKHRNPFHDVPEGTVGVVVRVELGCDYQMLIRNGKPADGSHPDDWRLFVCVPASGIGIFMSRTSVEIMPDALLRMDVVERWDKLRKGPIVAHETIGQGIFNTAGVDKLAP